MLASLGYWIGSNWDFKLSLEVFVPKVQNFVET